MHRYFLFTAGLAALIFILAGGCGSVDPPIPPAPDDPSVSAILEPGADQQGLLLTPTRPADDQEANQGRRRYIQSADVVVDSVSFRNRPADSLALTDAQYNYISDSLVVAPGLTYRLRVEIDDGRTVEGETTVPGAFDGSVENLRIVWEESEAAALYRVTVESAAGNTGTFSTQQLVTDTSLTIQPTSGFEAGDHLVTIDALDRNLAAFLSDRDSRAGVERAYGVFGARTRIVGVVSLPGPSDANGSDRSDASPASEARLLPVQ